MLQRKRVPRKQCPQCGWDAEGRLIDDPAARQGATKRVPPPPKYAYECENCGQQWIE